MKPQWSSSGSRRIREHKNTHKNTDNKCGILVRRKRTGAILQRGSSDVLEISKFLFLWKCSAYEKYFSDFRQRTKKRLIVSSSSRKRSSRGTLRRMSSKTWTSFWVSQIIYLGTSYAQCSRGTFASIVKQTRRTFFRTRILGELPENAMPRFATSSFLYLTSLKCSWLWRNNFHFARDKCALQKKEIRKSIEN